MATTRIAIAASQAEDIQEAALQAAISAKNQLDSTQTDLVVLLAEPTYAKPEALEVIHNVLRPQRLIGSSVQGIALSDRIFKRGIGILAINSDEMTFGISYTRPVAGADPRTTGFDWARQMSMDCKLQQHRACLMFTDPLVHNTPKFIHGAREVLGFGAPMMGAVSSNDPKTKKNIQFFQKQVLTQGAAGLVIGGVEAILGSKHGFKPLGKPRTITAVEGNIIQTIDDKPASHIYEEYFGIQAGGLNKNTLLSQVELYPLGIYMEEYGQYLLKNAVDIRTDGSIVCQGELAKGAEVHLMIGNRDSCRQSATDAALQVKEGLAGRQAKLYIIIESAIRQRILKNNSFLEMQAIKEVLGHSVPVLGIYSCGEMAAVAPGYETSHLQIQNGSILIVAID